MATMQDLIDEITNHDDTKRVIIMETQVTGDHQGLRVAYEHDSINGLVKDIRVNINIKDKGEPTEEAWFESKPPYMMTEGTFRTALKAKIAQIASGQGIINYTITTLSEDNEDAEVEIKKEVNSKIEKINYYAYQDGASIAFIEMA
jgi:hypothetical protein